MAGGGKEWEGAHWPIFLGYFVGKGAEDRSERIKTKGGRYC